MKGVGVALAVLAAAVVAGTAQPAHASRYLRIGIFDQTQEVFPSNATATYAMLKQLHVQEIRVTLYWGGEFGVARRKPAHPANPNDPAYDWTLYDRVVENAARVGIHVLFSIYGTPPWANGSLALNHAPTKGADLQNFARAAALHYDGAGKAADGTTVPAVKDWLAWNEPNNPIFLTPQYKKVGKTWVIQSAIDYSKICNAVYAGIHGTMTAGERVACGGTAPRGNNDPNESRPSVSPLAFLRAVKKDGLKTFDAWAHHPYYSSPSDQPTTKPVTAKGAPATAVTLGNINDLIKLVTQLYGNKRIWITEYGYQTNPPDTIFGVTYAQQAKYLTEAFDIAKKNPRIDMMLWFLLQDDPNLGGWQSGLLTAKGAKKPSFLAFEHLRA
jgi:Glycosyl hydrolase catalytic core